MAGWDVAQYLKFAGHRVRPALDLLAQAPVVEPETVHDLGCGAGNVTRLLAERWPAARVIGVDSSPDMLAKARAGGGAIEWVQGDLFTWRPAAPAELLYSNAALQWLDDHARLFPRLMGMLAPGGALMVQMPRNHGAPSHTSMDAAIAAGPWANRLNGATRLSPVADPAVYYDLLAPLARRVTIWETEYLQVLEGENPVVEFTRGTALKPLLDALEEPERGAFLADYAARVAAAYPKRADGKTLFPFRRLFIVAVR